MKKKNCITDIEGVRVGQVSDKENLTGCTVVLLSDGAVCGVNVCGGAPGSRESSLLESEKNNSKIHAIFLAGGSAFGLAVGDGVMEYLEENQIGFDTVFAKVPIVPGAVLYDLNVGGAKVRPTKADGYAACKNATDAKILEGNEGAGTGATVGKIYRNEVMMKSGIGSASFIGENGLVVAVIVVVNAFGNIRDSKGRILAGPLINNEPQDTIKLMEANLSNSFKYNMDNTTLAVVGTNAKLTKAQCNYLSQVAAHGLIRTISPVCTTVDGDTIFAFSKGTMQCDINILGALASKVLSEAIENAVKGADEVAGIKSYKSLI